MTRPFWKSALVALALVGLSASWASAQQAPVDVRVNLQPQQLRLGSAARMAIEVVNGRDARVFLPKVKDVVIESRGQNTSTQMAHINGRLTYQSTRTLIYSVIPYREGTITVPSFEIDVDGQTFQTKELQLQVLPGQAPAPQVQTPNPPRRASPAIAPGQPAPQFPRSSIFNRSRQPSSVAPTGPPVPNVAPASPGRQREEWAFLELVLPKKDVYVGETVPLEIKIYVHEEVRPNLTIPQISSDAFTFSELQNDTAKSSRERVGSEVYNVTTLPTTMTAVKEGSYPLEVSQETELTVPVAASPRDPFSGFGNRFFNRVRRFNKTLTSTPVDVTVKPLPTEGRPAVFDGALGEFDLTAVASPDTVDIGEPITLKTVVSGQGNLERVNAPSLVETDGWRVYPPTSTVQPIGDTNLRGLVTFEQAIVPKAPGTTRIPEIEFAFFNPNTGEYVTRRVPGPDVRIIGSPDAVRAAEAKTRREAEAAGETPAAPPEEDSVLVANETHLGDFTTNFSRVAVQPWYWAMNGGLGLVLAAAGWVAWRRHRLANDPAFSRRVRLLAGLKAEIGKMNAAVSANETEAFFAAARSAVQHRVALQTPTEPLEVTPETVADCAPAAAETAAEIFAQADAATYGGGASTRPMAEWHSLVTATLSQVEAESQKETVTV